MESWVCFLFELRALSGLRASILGTDSFAGEGLVWGIRRVTGLLACISFPVDHLFLVFPTSSGFQPAVFCLHKLLDYFLKLQGCYLIPLLCLCPSSQGICDCLCPLYFVLDFRAELQRASRNLSSTYWGPGIFLIKIFLVLKCQSWAEKRTQERQVGLRAPGLPSP